MNTPEAFKLIVKVESMVDTDSFTFNGLNTWPILRKILWTKLTSSHNKNKIQKRNYLIDTYIFIKRFISLIYCLFKKTKYKDDSEKIFISRPVYLQQLQTKKYFDKIVDPIIESSEKNYKFTKYYFQDIPKGKQLVYNYFTLHHCNPLRLIKISSQQKELIHAISILTKIDSLELNQCYKNELKSFMGWYISIKQLLKRHKKLKEIYIACWYFTETMAVSAAASELGIDTIDIQHGKQGRYQAMYSGWTKIPEEGYSLMPDSFWCWGQPSCDHILASSPNRKNHIPFIGGYPWLEYYKNNMAPLRSNLIDNKIRALFTMQPPQASNIERIPDFIIDFLSSSNIKDVHFIFRLHPNDDGYDYCKERLKLIKPKLYSIDRGNQNLYDILRAVTHHITAYSSCCYEASQFNVPTLLYGEESKEIYEDDIKNKVFKWIDSEKDCLEKWLCSSNNKLKISDKYINNTHKD